MSFLSLVCTLLLLLFNCESTFQSRLNRIPNGQKEYYYPSYLEYASRNKLDDQNQQQYSNQQESRFPSLVRPSYEGVAVEGPNRFTKYKNVRPEEPVPREVDLIRALGSYYAPGNQNARLIYVPRPEVENVEAYDANRDYNQDDETETIPRKAPELDYNLMRAMKKTLEAKNAQRRAIKENVLESAMAERTNTDNKPRSEPSAAKRVGEDNQHQVLLGSSSNRPSFESNFRSSKLSFLGSISDFYFIVIVACVSSIAIFSVMGAGYCFYKVQQQNKAASEVEFPSYGIVGPACRPGSTTPPKERKINQSAQMYHYQHQKQQMISNEKNNLPKHPIGSDIESDDENEDGEYTVYECPGLAPTGEMEVKNPLFQDDLTPMESPKVKDNKN